MSWTALPKAVPVVFGKASVCGSAPAPAGATGRADGSGGAGLGVGFSLGGLLALGDDLWVALTGVAVTFAPVFSAAFVPAEHPASTVSSAKAATAAEAVTARRPWTPVSLLVTTNEATRYGLFTLRRHRTSSADRNVTRWRQAGGMAGKEPAAPGSGGPVSSGAALDGFSTATRAWFEGAFAVPTQAQAQAWRAIGKGDDTLVIAPTGSGKTLAAFLWAIDRLAGTAPPADRKRRCRVLYISPLKALAVDIERNLRSPLTGIRHAAHRLGLPEPGIQVAVRTGDTAAEERRKLLTRP